MLSQDQRLYLEDVLGLNPAGYSLAQPSAPAPLSALVLTYPLTSDERALFAKILGSVTLGEYRHLEVERISLAEWPEDVQATRVLAFADYPTGRHEFAEGVWTVCPPVASMLGANADVASRKKETWNLLQAFARESS